MRLCSVHIILDWTCPDIFCETDLISSKTPQKSSGMRSFWSSYVYYDKLVFDRHPLIRYHTVTSHFPRKLQIISSRCVLRDACLDFCLIFSLDFAKALHQKMALQKFEDGGIVPDIIKQAPAAVLEVRHCSSRSVYSGICWYLFNFYSR